MKTLFIYASTIFLWSCSIVAYTQTCCSGGVPVSSNIGFQSSDKNTFQISLNADVNQLKTLNAGSTTLNDNLRKRTTQSYLLRFSYNFTDRFMIESLFSVVRQSRTIYSAPSVQSDFDATFGIGDPVILFTYDLIKEPFTFRVGAGPQIPIGKFDRRNDQGLFLVEDLQPGSGAWDVVIFSSLEFGLAFRPSLSAYVNSILSFNGDNSRSRAGNQTYSFGNEIQIIGGLTDQILLGTQIISPGISFRYRKAQRDAVNFIDNSGTGGEWVFTKFTFAFPLPFDSALTAYYEFPIYSFVNETQLSPTSIFGLSIFKKFKTSDTPLINVN